MRSYDSDSMMLSVWNDVGANGDVPIMTATVPALSSDTVYPAFGAWNSNVEFTLAQWVEVGMHFFFFL